ncbi:NAD(P)/FAD-dependent oxidoreductase [Microvirga sp. TS319]|uniref:NAD(P)/FAD-dependent oxidoreductase n=1 Tax=Microvirga sp. TS319 TaxID=3241165 RepID=UPI00351A3FC9
MTPGKPMEEVAIVGGGPAGSSAACLLARAGRPVLLMERSAESHHKVCGEFLSVEAQDYLAHLGIDLDRLGASAISSVRIICNRTIAEAALPFRARGLSRKSLDEALLNAAASSGARIERGATVRSIAPDRAGWSVDRSSGDQLQAHALFLATGKHDLRGGKRVTARTRDDMIGFKTHLALAPAQRSALDGAVEIVLFPGGYAGLQIVEGGIANLCLLVSRECFDGVGKRWDKLLEFICDSSSPMASRLDGAAPVTPRPLAIFGIPYGFIHTPLPSEPEGLFRLGDQLAVTPSFTGDGMSIALHSGFISASAFLRHGRESSIYHREIRSHVRAQIRIASLIHDAGRWPRGQQKLVTIFQTWPGVLRSVAALTRLRSGAIHRALVAP